MMYSTTSRWERAMLSSIRRMATTRKIPTPMATARISVWLGMEGTSSASTCRSGSEMVMMTPSMKLRSTMNQTFFVWVILAPTFSPMGVMDISAPNVKNIMPTMTSSAPIRKLSRMLGDSGASVKLSARTMTMTGTTAARASDILCCIFGFQSFN